MTIVREDVSTFSCVCSSFLKYSCATLEAVTVALRSISWMVVAEDDRLFSDEAEDGGTRFEDARLTVGARGVVFELAMYEFDGDLLIVCNGVDERLSIFEGRDDRRCAGDCVCGEGSSIRNWGVSCDALTGDDGGKGIAEALFKEAWSRVD